MLAVCEIFSEIDKVQLCNKDVERMAHCHIRFSDMSISSMAVK